MYERFQSRFKRSVRVAQARYSLARPWSGTLWLDGPRIQRAAKSTGRSGN